MHLSKILLLAVGLCWSQWVTASQLKLWYRQPATNWHGALPIGNGRLGALIFGNPTNELLHLNEDSVWSGHPYSVENSEVRENLEQVRKLLFAGRYAEAQALAEKHMTMKPDPRYGAYQPLGDLRLNFHLPEADIKNYSHELDLETAVARTTFESGRVKFSREVFASFPDNSVVLRLTASRSGMISFDLEMNRAEGAVASVSGSDTVVLAGQAALGGATFEARSSIIFKGGTLTAEGNRLCLRNADAATIILVANTDYYRPNPSAQNTDQLALAAARPFGDLRERHIADYQPRFGRVQLELAAAATSGLPTDERLNRIKAGASDPAFDALYFQYGRYLLVASSRPGSLPANLQGIWNPLFKPPWFSDYTININCQMNYWPAEVANLAECHEPLFDLIGALQDSGRQTAKERYGCRGTTMTTRTTPWHSNDLRGSAGLLWQEGMAWLCAHLWQHYEFSLDREFLARRAYPAMKEACLFYLDFMVQHPTKGWLVSGPSTSPENNYLTPDGKRVAIDMGPTMTMQIIRELFGNTVHAADILGVDPEFRVQLRDALGKLAPMRIGEDGRLLEWSEDFKEVDPGHRHTSHLYGLYPGNQITLRGTPDLAAAARKSLEARLRHGGGYVGWGRAWLINLWTRLEEGDLAHENLMALYAKSTFPNLFDNHWRQGGEVFQVDGNFGATAAIAEMLVQSHAEEIHLLPALPGDWAEGWVKGLRARGGYDVEIRWRKGRLDRAVIRSAKGGVIKVRYAGKVISLDVPVGGDRQVRAGDFK